MKGKKWNQGIAHPHLWRYSLFWICILLLSVSDLKLFCNQRTFFYESFVESTFIWKISFQLIELYQWKMVLLLMPQLDLDHKSVNVRILAMPGQAWPCVCVSLRFCWIIVLSKLSSVVQCLLGKQCWVGFPRGGGDHKMNTISVVLPRKKKASSLLDCVIRSVTFKSREMVLLCSALIRSHMEYFCAPYLKKDVDRLEKQWKATEVISSLWEAWFMR